MERSPRRVAIEDEPAPSFGGETDYLDPMDEEVEDFFEDRPVTVEEVLARHDGHEGDFSELYGDLLDLGLSHDGAMEAAGYRKRDLAPAVQSPPPPVSRRGHARSEFLEGPEYALGPTGEAIPLDEDGDADGPDRVAAVPRRYEDTHQDPAVARRSRETATWLQENDPRRTAAGVATEVRSALEAADLTPEDVAEAFKPVRPTPERAALRERLREALTPAHEAGLSRSWMADALGCSRRALERLLAA